MVQLVKSTKDFDISARNPGTVRVSTGNSKAAVILAGCAVLGPATAVFRFIGSTEIYLVLSEQLSYKRSQTMCQPK